MKNNKKKGFTLVELLVVIAILAILASVSVVGYLGFTKNAKESNARTEMTQYKTMMLASLTDGKEHVEVTKTSEEHDNCVYFEMNDQNVITVYSVTAEGQKGAVLTDKAKTTKALNTWFELKGTTENVITDVTFDSIKTNQIATIVYTGKGATATWTLATDEIKTAA